MKNAYFRNVDIDYIGGLTCFFQVQQDESVEVIQSDAIIGLKAFSKDSFSFG